jgi:hypothetical protein
MDGPFGNVACGEPWSSSLQMTRRGRWHVGHALILSRRYIVCKTERITRICFPPIGPFVSIRASHLAEHDFGMLFGSSGWKTSPYLF